MKILRIILLLSIVTNMISCKKSEPAEVSLIPKPASLVQEDGMVTINKNYSIFLTDQEKLGVNSGYLAARFKSAAGFDLPVANKAMDKAINLVLDEGLISSLGSEGYQLVAAGKSITISAGNEAGIFYGIQTLFQLLPPEIYSDKPVPGIIWAVPSVSITDSPRFPWRGYMLDVSRHFFPVSHIYRVIDQLAYHKLNRLHLHLTDDQGWRIEIKKYPRLTDIGAWRVNREDKHWNSREPQKPGEIADYGGFYTQDEIRSFVQYAAERNITIIPEIEMPAHATAALASYPEFSCTGQPLTVLPGGIWPCANIFCAGKEETFAFLEDVLAEVIDLFPSEMIHIGGDEAYKAEWIKCPLCQKRIRTEGLKDEHELQSYFVQRIEKFLNSKGRILIGWDEILEGGLAENAAVMSWRGTQGGIEAAQANHPVVMSPTSHCYFDYYQGNPEMEPLAIGGYLPLAKVYSFEPVPEELAPEQGRWILGAQANLWTEYVADPGHADYMTYPRLTALAEVCWVQKESKNYDDFLARLPRQLSRYESMGINYSNSFASVEVVTNLNSANQLFEIELHSAYPGTEIRYTLDGTDPSPESLLYAAPFTLDKTATIKAMACLNGKPFSKTSTKEVMIHLASGKPVIYAGTYSPNYTGGGDGALVNSVRGTINMSDGAWQGFEGNDLIADIDLGSVVTLKKISVGALQSAGSWVFFPRMAVFATAGEDMVFQVIGTVQNQKDLQGSAREIQDFSVEFSPVQARHIRVTVINTGVCPPWHAGAGNKAWMFIDEIIVE